LRNLIFFLTVLTTTIFILTSCGGTSSGKKKGSDEDSITDFDEMVDIVEVDDNVKNDGDVKFNSAPDIESTPKESAKEHEEYSYKIICNDPDGDDVTLSKGDDDNCGGTLEDGTYRFTPSENQGGTKCDIQIVCSDGEGEASQKTEVTIEEDHQAPIISNLPETKESHWNGSNGFFTAEASDSDGDSFVWSIDSNCDLDSGIDKTSGEITWKCVKKEDCELNVTATDVSSDALSDTKILTVSCTNTSPEIAGDAPETADEGFELSFPITCSDSDSDDTSFSVGTNDTCIGAVTGVSYSFTPGTSAGGTTCYIEIICSDTQDSSSLTQTVEILNNPKMLKNVRTTTYNISPRDPLNYKGTLFLGGSGYERLYGQGWGTNYLWKYDATTKSLQIVKKIIPDHQEGVVSRLTVSNDTLYFVGSNYDTGDKLWKSDGTEAGTTVVKGAIIGQYISNLIDVNGTLLFILKDDSHGSELWKSNGTEAGTALVKDIMPGSGDSMIMWLANAGGTLLFSATESGNDSELWKSDGTEAGTVMVKDINPGDTGSSPKNLTDINGTLFFTADDGTNGRELWKSDGTPGGTSLVKNINSSGNSEINKFHNLNGTAIFDADDGINGRELWKSDGTENGTVMIKDINPGSESSLSKYSTFFSSINNTLYFNIYSSTDKGALWKSDGTESGTVKVTDINVQSEFAAVGGALYMSAYKEGENAALWKSDGTEAGTTMLNEILPNGYGYGGAAYPHFTEVSGTLFFVGFDVNSHELWKTDGTESGTARVDKMKSGSSGSLPELVGKSGNTLFLSLRGDSEGKELWKCDGTTSGTALLKDIAPGKSSSFPFEGVEIGGTLYFAAYVDETGFSDTTYPRGYSEIWKSDGTEAGTVRLKRVDPGSRDTKVTTMTNAGGILFFLTKNNYLTTLWKSDGTEAGTVKIKEADTSAGTEIFKPVPFGPSVLFTSTDSTNGKELWISDGTTVGTQILKDINVGTENSEIFFYGSFKNKFYFKAYDGSLWHLYVTDGTKPGTRPLKTIDGKGESQYQMEIMTSYGNDFYFSWVTSSDSVELWKSDGTEIGTEKFTILYQMTGDRDLYEMTIMNGTLYFIMDDGTGGEELWRTDGTVPVTAVVKDINSGTGGSKIRNLTNVGDRIFFTAYDMANGFEIWETDGTDPGTNLVEAVLPGNLSNEDISILGNIEGKLVFTTKDGSNGLEPWVYRFD